MPTGTDSKIGLGYLIAPEGPAHCMMLVKPALEDALEAHEILGACQRFQVRVHYHDEQATISLEGLSDPIPIAQRRGLFGEVTTLCAQATYSGEWVVDSRGAGFFVDGVKASGGFFIILYCLGQAEPAARPIFAVLNRG
jgi:hypothetical protein